MDNLLIYISSLLTAVGGTGYFTFLFTRSKYKVDVLQAQENAETTAIENDIKLSGHYKEILDDLKNRYETRYKEFEDIMNKKMKLLEDEIKMRDKKIKMLEVELSQLRKENKILKINAKTTIT